MELTILAQGLPDFRLSTPLADLARLSLKLSLPRCPDAWQPHEGRQRPRYCIARTRSPVGLRGRQTQPSVTPLLSPTSPTQMYPMPWNGSIARMRTESAAERIQLRSHPGSSRARGVLQASRPIVERGDDDAVEISPRRAFIGSTNAATRCILSVAQSRHWPT